MQRKTLVKPDGRSLHLYSRTEITSDPAPSPGAEALHPNPHLRWHPLRAEWVTYAAQRQSRPFLPPSDYNPLAPTTNPAFPTELPQGDYEIAVFDNRFPSLALGAHDPPDSITPTAAGIGHCEVVVFSQDASDSLSKMSLGKLELLIEVWTERYLAIGAIDAIEYVMPFENRGVEMGVTLHHPHGQIYAYDHVPPVPARELEQQQRFFDLHGRGLLEEIIAQELESLDRLVARAPSVIAFIPAFARYPFEVWIAPIRAAASLAALTDEERKDLAVVLKTVLLKFDHLFESDRKSVV